MPIADARAGLNWFNDAIAWCDNTSFHFISFHLSVGCCDGLRGAFCINDCGRVHMYRQQTHIQ